MKRLADAAFQRVFSHLFVYNILFEDSEVDERFLGIDTSSTVLGISGAGCRIAGHLSQRPKRVDAVDINRHHLALTALKVQAAQQLSSYEEFYGLFGPRLGTGLGRVVGKLARACPTLCRAPETSPRHLLEGLLRQRADRQAPADAPASRRASTKGGSAGS